MNHQHQAQVFAVVLFGLIAAYFLAFYHALDSTSSNGALSKVSSYRLSFASVAPKPAPSPSLMAEANYHTPDAVNWIWAPAEMIDQQIRPQFWASDPNSSRFDYTEIGLVY